MVIRQRKIEGQRRRLEIEKEKGGISTSNMTTTQGAGLGGNMGGREGDKVGGGGGRKGRAVVVMFIVVFTFLIHFYSSIGKRRKEIER